MKDVLSMSPAFAKAAAGLALVEGGTQLWQKAKKRWDDRTTYTVVIGEEDPAYFEVHRWLLSQVPDREHRSLMLRSGDQSSKGNIFESSESERSSRTVPTVDVLINDATDHWLTIGGYRVKVSISKPDNAGSAGESRRRRMDWATMTFSSRSHEGQQAVIARVREIRAKVAERKPSLKMIAPWGGWRHQTDVPERSLDSVILPTDQKTRIRGDLERFLADEGRYARLGMPYHRGYMLHGPPGTGKTSLVKALSQEFGLDLWYAPLGDLNDEISLMSVISEVGARSILLLEDIDSVRISNDRATQDGGSSKSTVTTSSLLNALDGVATPHGLITVMTTNHFDKLDPALTRPGRMDLVEFIDTPSRDMVGEMFRHFYGSVPDDVPWSRGISQAQVAEVFKRHMDDPAAALSELHAQAALAAETL